ncbi:Imm1 family immunity protein [Actinokineospora sp. 24-640]
MTPLNFWHARGQDGSRVAATPDEIDAELDHVATLDGGGILTTITLTSLPGLMYAGFNGDVGVAYYGEVGAAYYSQGEPRDGEPLIYDLQQHVAEFPPDAEIPAADVRTAVHEFARTGNRPANIRWQRWEPPVEPGATLAHDDSAWG